MSIVIIYILYIFYFISSKQKKEKKICYSLRREDQNPRSDELQNMACVIETYTDELLFTNVGRRSLKVSKATVIVGNTRIFVA